MKFQVFLWKVLYLYIGALRQAVCAYEKAPPSLSLYIYIYIYIYEERQRLMKIKFKAYFLNYWSSKVVKARMPYFLETWRGDQGISFLRYVCAASITNISQPMIKTSNRWRKKNRTTNSAHRGNNLVAKIKLEDWHSGIFPDS